MEEASSQSNAEPEDLSDFQEESSNDDDIFRGPFAIKDKEDKEEVTHLQRLQALPSKIANALESFEPQVLESIPTEVGEPLGDTVA